MRRADVTSAPTQTPLPVVVDVGTVPQARDSAKSFAVDVPHTEPERHAHRSRGLIKALIIPTVVVASTVGPHAVDAVFDDNRSAERAAIAELETETPPPELEFAQLTATQKLFGMKGKGFNVDAAHEAANKPGKGELLNANSYVNPEHVQVGEDGRYFTVQGKDYELARRKTEAGDVYIVAGRHFVKEGILKDREKLVGLMLVGGARNDASSDLNKDGVVTPEEIRISADQSARHNLDRAFQPLKRIVVSQNTVKTE